MLARWTRRKKDQRLRVTWEAGTDAWRVRLVLEQDGQTLPLPYPLPNDPKYLTLPGVEAYIGLSQLQDLLTDPPVALRKLVSADWSSVSVEHLPYDVFYALLEASGDAAGSASRGTAPAGGPAGAVHTEHVPAQGSTSDATHAEDDDSDDWEEIRMALPALLQELGLPTEPIPVQGRVELRSAPREGEVGVVLWDRRGYNLERTGRRRGAVIQRDGRYELLPRPVWELYKAVQEPADHGYQRLAACQHWARLAGLQLTDMLARESYVLVDSYDVDVVAHAPDHLELVPTYHGRPIDLRGFSDKDGWLRTRYYPTPRVLQDLRKIEERRHLKGADVGRFLADPLSVLPEHNYLFDFEGYSDRVKGLVPFRRISPVRPSDGGRGWFEMESDDGQEAEPLSDEELRDILSAHPDDDFVLHQGHWVHVPPSVRQAVLQGVPRGAQDLGQETADRPGPGEVSGQGSSARPADPVPHGYVLDIYENEHALEYELGTGEIPEDLPDVAVPESLRADLYDHQVAGFRWLVRQWRQRAGGLLADDMGLGKTVQVLTLLAHLHEQGELQPTLLVLPVAVVQTWKEAMARFTPSLPKPYEHTGASRVRSTEWLRQQPITLTTYDTLRRDQLLFGKVDYRAVICDEAQSVKSHSTQRSHALRALKADFRLAMTGTPVENGMEELWAIMDFVQPGCLGSLHSFRTQHGRGQHIGTVLRKIRPHYLRRTKDEVLKDALPPKSVQVIRVPASPEQQARARAICAQVQARRLNPLEGIAKLRMLYAYPGAVDSSLRALEPERIPKLAAVLKVLDDVRDRGEKALVFTESRAVQRLLADTFRRRYGLMWLPVINGEVANREALVYRFNHEPGFGICILSPRAAGVGLTLTAANHVIHYTRWWNPAVENQATDRAHRIGQTRPVTVYHVITCDPAGFANGTAEEKLDQILESKRALAEKVLIPFDIGTVQREVAHALFGAAANSFIRNDAEVRTQNA
ncbi:MAG: DEAD/DEAH box helicase [Alicyclobacillus sp.]|nr:DEAD/DEAH box helicase [Alicyclobacillus sp.]